MEKNLPEMVKEYLEAKYRENPHHYLIPVVYPVHYHVSFPSGGKSLEGKKLKWSVCTAEAICMAVEEDEDGKVWVLSDNVDYVRDMLYDRVKEKAYDIMIELRDRRSWKKYRKDFGKEIGYLAWKDEIAKRMTEETGIKIVHQIGLPEYYDTAKMQGIFYAVMDMKNLSDSVKFLFIVKMIDAIDETFRLGLFADEIVPEEYENFMKKFVPAKGSRRRSKKKRSWP